MDGGLINQLLPGDRVNVTLLKPMHVRFSKTLTRTVVKITDKYVCVKNDNGFESYYLKSKVKIERAFE